MFCIFQDKDILVQNQTDDEDTVKKAAPVKNGIKSENMSSAWGDAFDYYLRGITARYLQFGGRATRLEFWGYAAAASLLYIPLYFLGDYIDQPLLPYYYALATLIPAAAVATRRLHDINKRATLYLIITAVLCVSCFLALAYAIIPMLLWMLYMAKVFTVETYEEDGLYGAPNEDDEIYGSDSLPIIRTFRLIAIVMSIFWLGFSLVKFDDWSRQSEQKGNIDTILEEVLIQGQEQSLSPQQIDAAQTEMKNILKKLQGKSVSQPQLKDYIQQVIQHNTETSPNAGTDTEVNAGTGAETNTGTDTKAE